jgi:hypothetical protein
LFERDFFVCFDITKYKREMIIIMNDEIEETQMERATSTPIHP